MFFSQDIPLCETFSLIHFLVDVFQQLPWKDNECQILTQKHLMNCVTNSQVHQGDSRQVLVNEQGKIKWGRYDGGKDLYKTMERREEEKQGASLGRTNFVLRLAGGCQRDQFGQSILEQIDQLIRENNFISCDFSKKP